MLSWTVRGADPSTIGGVALAIVHCDERLELAGARWFALEVPALHREVKQLAEAPRIFFVEQRWAASGKRHLPAQAADRPW